MHKNKVCLIAHDLAGGGMTRTYALAQALQLSGYKVEILGLKLTNSGIYPLPPQGIPVVEITGLTLFSRLIKLLRCIDSEIVYAIKPRPTSYGVALIKRLFCRCYVVLDIDDLEEPFKRLNDDSLIDSTQTLSIRCLNFAKNLKRLIHNYINMRRWLNPVDRRYIRWMKNKIKNADEITVNNRYLHGKYGGIYVPSCKDIHQYDPARYDSDQCRVDNGLSDYYVLMFPGTARPHKGLEDLLSAMVLLNRPDLRLVLVGGRVSSHAYVKKLMMHWGQWIIRLPGCSTEAMPAMVAAAHVIVVPQRDTVFARAQAPMKLTDAMCMAKPILSTTVGMIPEVLGGAGFLVDPSSPQQLASKLEFIINNPDEAKRKGIRARERFVDCYSLESVSPIFSKMVESIKSKGRLKTRKLRE